MHRAAYSESTSSLTLVIILTDTFITQLGSSANLINILSVMKNNYRNQGCSGQCLFVLGNRECVVNVLIEYRKLIINLLSRLNWI